jgi:serine/threonine-protein kinase
VDQLREGLVLGYRFRLVGPVGGGGPGAAWRAVDEVAGREVAVKSLDAPAAAGDRAGPGLVFATVAALSSPGIAQVYDYGEEPPAYGRPAVPYLVRELVPGRTLEQRLAGGSLPAAEALRFVASVADTLAAAHSTGVVHGNLVPANVIDGPGGVKVTDFGLWALRDHRPSERFQSVLSYTAPERLSGGPATTASDMYSLGVLFVACLSGIAAAGTAGSPPVTDPDEDPVPPSLAALWAACLGASPRERPSAAHVAFMSRQLLAAEPRAVPRPEPVPARPDEGLEAGPAGPASGPAERRGALVAAGTWAANGDPGRPASGRRAGRGPSGRNGGRGPGSGRAGKGHHGRRGPWGRPGRTVRGRGGILALGGAATGVTVAAVILTQFLTSPAVRTTGAAATPSVNATATGPPRPSRTAGSLLPSPEATSSVLASSSPAPLQVLGEIRATLRHDVAAGQIRQDVAVDITNLIQPVQGYLAAGATAQVRQLVATLRTKLAARLSEGAISRAASQQLGGELTALLRSVSGTG